MSKKKSKFERTVMFFGLLAGIIVWLKRSGTPKALEQGASTASHKAHDLLDEAKHKAETFAHSVTDGERGEDTGTQASGEDAVAVEPDVHAGEETVASPELGVAADTTDYQHGALGGIPADAATGEGDTLAASRDESTSDESAFAYGARPYGADVSDEGVILTPESDQEREDVPLDEGFPNLAEPGDDDTELTAPDVDDDEDEASAWVGDTTEGDAFPAASRGLAEEAEFTGEDEDVDAYRDPMGDELDSLAEDEVSGAGGEVDLMNDESPAYDESEMSIVDSPDEPLSADAAGFDHEEMTLGLRDSESLESAADGGLDLDAGGDDHLDVSGTFAEAEATEEMPATTGTGAETESGDALRDSFVTGQDADSLDAEFDFDAGGTGDAAGTAGAFDRYDAGADVSTSMQDGDGEHLDVSGDFDEAEATETIPAAPSGDESGLSGDDLRESFVTGADADEAAAAEPGDVDHDLAGTESEITDDAGESGATSAAHSAAWSTPAGVTLSASGAPEGAGDHEHVEEPDPASEGPATGVDEELADAVSEPGDSELGHDTGGDDLSDAGVETLTGGEEEVSDAVDESVDSKPGDRTSDEQATNEPEPFISTPGDLSGGDPMDLASADVGDLGTSVAASAYSPDADDRSYADGDLSRFSPDAGEQGTDDVADDVAHQVYRAPSADSGAGSAPASGLASDRDASVPAEGERDGEEKPARKSRRDRRKESNWVPAGAVKGDGSPTCPADHPIKGNANSRIYHRPTDPSYEPTIPEYCFASEEDAQKAGFRAPKGH